MKILSRYLLKQLLLATASLSLIMTAAVWLTQSLRFMDLVVNKGVKVFALLQLVLYLLPDLLTIILPLALVISVLFIYNKLSIDKELIVLRAIGLSNFSIARPALGLALAMTGALYGISLYGIPIAFKEFRTLELSLRNKYTAAFLREGEFHTINNITVFVKERSKEGELKGILVYDRRTVENPITYTAEAGMILEGALGPRLVMLNGTRQAWDGRSRGPAYLLFDRYVHNLQATHKINEDHRAKPSEKYVWDLLGPQDAKLDARYQRNLRIEGHRRLLFPWNALSYTSIALYFLTRGNRKYRQKSWEIFKAVNLIVLLQILGMGSLNLVDRFSLALPLSYLTGIFPMVVCLALLVRSRPLIFLRKRF